MSGSYFEFRRVYSLVHRLGLPMRREEGGRLLRNLEKITVPLNHLIVLSVDRSMKGYGEISVPYEVIFCQYLF